MANYKISELGDTTAITDDDFFPVVDNGSSTTQRVDAQVVKEYITGSVVNSLSASVLSGSDTYTTTLTSSYTTGSDAKLTTLSASFVTGSDAKFTSISGNLEGNATTATTASNVKVISTGLTNSKYYIPFVSDYTTGDRVLYSDSDIAYNPFLSDLSASNISGKLKQSITFNSNGGMLPGASYNNTAGFIVSYNTVGAAGLGANNTFTQINTFSNNYITASVGITGSDAKFTSITASSITANEYNVVTINRTTLSQEGSTKFGDDELDTHQFSGSMYVSGNVSGAIANFTTLNGNLDWSNVQSVPTEIANAAGTASNNTFVGVNTFNTHYVTASQGVTGSDGKFTTLSASYVTGSDAKFTSISGNLQGNATTATTATNVTVTATDNNATYYIPFINGHTTDDRALYSDSAITYNPASNYLSASILGGKLQQGVTFNSGGGFQPGVSYNNTAGFTVSYNTVGAAGLGANNTFTKINTFNNNYVTASVGITGSDAKFTSVSASFNGNGSQITNLTASNIDNFTADVRSQFTAGTNITINNGEISSSANTSLAADNTFTGINTFNQTITGSITGSVAEFTNLSGNLDWSYIVNEPTFLESSDTITLSGDATGSGTGATSIAIGDVTASFIKAGTDGSNLTNLTASQLSNFTNDVRSQFTAGTNIIINNGEISASLASAGDVFLDSDNTFTAVNTFDTHYITASVGITGTNASFSSVTASQELKVGFSYMKADGLGNINIGWETALDNNTSGVSNVGFGYGTYSSNTTGNRNTSIGHYSLENNETGNSNTSIGNYSLENNETGNGNVAAGFMSLRANISGSGNTALGTASGKDLVSGSNNIFIGSNSGLGETNLENTVIINTDREVVRINNAGQLSASSFIGDGSSLNNLTASQISNFTQDVRTQFTAGTNIIINNGEISASGGGSGDVLSGSGNTFTAVNTFSNHYLTASVGVTGSDAKFTTLSGNIDWTYVVGEPNSLSGYGITDAVDLTSTQTITGQKTFSDQNNVFTGSFIASNIIEKTAGLGIPMSGNVDISGSIVANMEISAEITSTSYTVDLSDRGRTLLFNNAATQEITCSAGLNTGFTCTFIQMGAGQLILTASSGATLLNRQDHTGSAGQYAAVSIVVVGSNQYLIAGDTV